MNIIFVTTHDTVTRPRLQLFYLPPPEVSKKTTKSIADVVVTRNIPSVCGKVDHLNRLCRVSTAHFLERSEVGFRTLIMQQRRYDITVQCCIVCCGGAQGRKANARKGYPCGKVERLCTTYRCMTPFRQTSHTVMALEFTLLELPSNVLRDWVVRLILREISTWSHCQS